MPTKKDEAVPIQCVCFEYDETKIDPKTKKPHPPTCQAIIETTPWKVDDTTQTNYCKTSNFANCPRLEVFMTYQNAVSTLKIRKIE